MSEEKNDKPAEAGNPAPENSQQKSRKGIFPFVVIVALVILLVLVVMGFLNGQKLNRQVVLLERRLATLQAQGHKTEGRLQALANELAVRTLQQQQRRLRRARRALNDLKPALKANPDLAGRVEKLVKELKQESLKLGREIPGRHPAARFRPDHATRPSACPRAAAEAHKVAAPAAGRLECANGVCRLAAEKPTAEKPPAGKDYSVNLPGGDEPSHPAAAAVAKRPDAAAAEAAAQTGSSRPRPRNWWARFISLRIFGGN